MLFVYARKASPSSVIAMSLAVAATAAYVAPPVRSQEAPQGPSLRSTAGIGLGLNYARYAKINVFRDPRVQSELKVTESERAQLKQFEETDAAARSRFMEQYQEQVKALGESPDRGALAELKAARTAYGQASVDRFDAALKRILGRPRFARLEQIWYQTEGPMAFTRPEFQERLNFSPEQSQLVTEIVNRGDVELGKAARLPAGALADPVSRSRQQRIEDRETVAFKNAVKKVQDSASAVRADTMRQIARVLTKGQREKYEKLIGEPFDFSKTWAPATDAATQPKQEPRPPG
jgi:Spy/CpxP family protein refolding chaperone